MYNILKTALKAALKVSNLIGALYNYAVDLSLSNGINTLTHYNRPVYLSPAIRRAAKVVAKVVYPALYLSYYAVYVTANAAYKVNPARYNANYPFSNFTDHPATL